MTHQLKKKHIQTNQGNKMLNTNSFAHNRKALREVHEFSSRLIHFEPLKSSVELIDVYHMCGSEFIVKENTIGIATPVILTCKNKHCYCKQESCFEHIPAMINPLHIMLLNFLLWIFYLLLL